MKLYRNWIINEVARAGEHTNERTNVRTYVLTYIRTGQTLYPLHNFVVRGDNNDVYYLDFRAQKFPVIFFHANPFLNQQDLRLGVLNYETQHKEGTCKVSGRSVVFSAFYAEFCLCPKSVIITTLNHFKWKLIRLYFFNF